MALELIYILFDSGMEFLALNIAGTPAMFKACNGMALISLYSCFSPGFFLLKIGAVSGMEWQGSGIIKPVFFQFFFMLPAL